MTQRKAKKPNNLHLLDTEQRKALDKYQKDFKTATPQLIGLATTAKRLHDSMINADVWRVVEAPKPEGAPEEPEMWSVGHAKVNYVDHIKTEGTQ